MKRILPFLLMGLLFLVGIGLAVYPLISNTLYERNQSHVLEAYDRTVEQMEQTALSNAMEAANAYNEGLAVGVSASNSLENVEAQRADSVYDQLLCLTEDGMMGYLEIPRLQLYLPIYHGADSEILAQGVGHLQGSSLPVGGNSTHAVLTGHTGMSGKRMFTDLTELELKDVFYLHVLGQTLAYEVSRIDIVEPEDATLLEIQDGADMVTLVTCYPYGINTQRLLVRGLRIPLNPEQNQLPKSGAEAYESHWQLEYQKAVLVSVAAYVPLTGIVLLILLRRKRKRT